MTMPSTSARASGLLLWSFRRRLALLPLADISTGSATLQRSSFAVLGACGGHPKTRRCARPARWSTGRLRRIAELLTRGSVIVGRRCDQPPSGAPRRAGRAAGAGSGAPRLLAGHATAGAALPGTPGAWTCLPGAGPTRTRNAAAVRARASRLSRRIPARRWWHMAGGTPGRESPGVRVGGRARFRSLPAAGLPALSSVRSRQRAAQRRDSSLCVQRPRRLLSLVRHRAPCRCSRPASTRAWLSPRSRYRRRSGRMFRGGQFSNPVDERQPAGLAPRLPAGGGASADGVAGRRASGGADACQPTRPFPAAGRENVTVNWQVSVPKNLTACRRRRCPSRPPAGPRQPVGKRDGQLAGSGAGALDRLARPRVGEWIGDHRSPRDDHLDRPRRADSTATRRSAAARARRWLCRPGQWRSSPRLGHTRPPFREEAIDDDNGNPAPAAERAPNRNAQRSPAPPSQALAKVHPADGEAAFARVEQSIEQLPSTVEALEPCVPRALASC